MKLLVLCGLATVLCFSFVVHQSGLTRPVPRPQSENWRTKECNGIVVDYQVVGPVGLRDPLNKYHVRGTITNTRHEAVTGVQLRIGDARDFVNQSTARFRSFITDWCICAAPGATKKFSVMVTNGRSDELIDIQIWPNGWTGSKRCAGKEGPVDVEVPGRIL